ncbi:uncharacterized protein LOC113646308 isoform X2 [Tachysurus fulvidraco]|uniref:uncharacterized protein LOC113646308 isoform X2 n=1 Tax=Tachysurus fulvidraco TaxID=1234273 RepID=UPI001FEFE4F5|nr:uncharacterized protein LOC113646308 isoform X2 [Tachysurus fulvidraco]
MEVDCHVLCDVPAPENITMDSKNFVHLLKWEAGPGSPAGLHYSVIFRSYGNGWMTVDSCVEVRSPLLCNLTDVLSDPNLTYYINVTAFLGKETSAPQTCRPFRPFADTEPEPPSIRMSPCNDSLCVYLQSPSQRLEEVYRKFHYTFSVTNEKGVELFPVSIQGFDPLELKVVPGWQYCVSIVKIDGRKPTHKTPVCSSKPAAVNNMDVEISVGVTVLVLGSVVIVGLVTYRRHLKTDPPLVLSSFNTPYKVQLFSPSVESLTSILLEPNTCRNVQVTEEADQEKEDEEVTYERLRGCEEVECCEEISKETKSSLPMIPEVQFECNHETCTKTYSDGNVLKEQTLAPDEIRPHWEVTSPSDSQILTTHHLPLKKQIPEHKKNNSILLRYKTEDGHRQENEEKEDSDNVNFFSLILGGQRFEQRDEAEEEEQIDDVLKMKPEVPLFVLEPSKPAMDLQPTTSSESTDKHISYSDEEEDEDTEEEEEFSGYMMRKLN